jgi:hypothetical protein
LVAQGGHAHPKDQRHVAHAQIVGDGQQVNDASSRSMRTASQQNR